MLQFLIITNRIFGFLRVNCVNCIFIRYFQNWTGPNPTTQDGEFCDPTRPMDEPDPCPTLICLQFANRRVINPAISPAPTLMPMVMYDLHNAIMRACSNLQHCAKHRPV